MGLIVTDTLLAVAPVGPARLAQITARAAARPGMWLDLVRFDAARRWYRRLALHDDHEVWLLSWLPGQETGFHDHGASSGAFTVALGTLRERSGTGGFPDPSGRTLVRGSVRSFGPDYVHDVRNDSAEPAVSIHAYSPPLTSMRRFDVSDGGGLRLARVEVRSW